MKVANLSSVKPLIMDLNTINYPLLLAVSTDSLLVVDKDFEPIEWIRHGQDNTAFLCSFDNEEDFLDWILLFSYDIDNKISFMDYLQILLN